MVVRCFVVTHSIPHKKAANEFCLLSLCWPHLKGATSIIVIYPQILGPRSTKPGALFVGNLRRNAVAGRFDLMAAEFPWEPPCPRLLGPGREFEPPAGVSNLFQ
jgi:hypothetical protein